MPTLLLSFANSAHNPLPSLREEDTNVNNVLNTGILRNDFKVKNEQYATTDIIINDLRTFKDDIVLFLYSGHAGRDALLLENDLVHAEGIAAMLGRCPNLKLVILNGCSTGGQVAALFKNNVPMVIATSASVDDRRATEFSTNFFRELAENRASVRTAFDAAVAAAKVHGTINSEVRAIGHINEAPQSATWGLFFQENRNDLLDWRLPESKQTIQTNRYLNNAIAGIYDDFEKILNEQGEETNAQEVILKRLPYSISEPIRKLLAPSDNSPQIFYDMPSPQRYKMLLYAYRSIISFCTFVLLAQVWEGKRKSDSHLENTAIDTAVKIWLTTQTQTDEKQSLLPLLKVLVLWMKDKQIPFFLTELPEAFEELDEPEHKEAIDFLENQLEKNTQSGLDYLCENTENYLAVVLYNFGFLIHYGLTSIKDINVLFYMNSEVPDFEHKIVKLQQALTQLEDRTESEKTYYKTASVLLRRMDDKTKYIYLSPFLIDENAYTKTAKAKLCYFTAYDVAKKQFQFRHVSKPDDIIRIEKKKVSIMAKIKGDATQNDNYFPLINGQFSAFCKTVLGKTLDEL